MNLYVVKVKSRTYSSDLNLLHIVAANTTRASELAMAVAKRNWHCPEVVAVEFDRKIDRIAK